MENSWKIYKNRKTPKEKQELLSSFMYFDTVMPTKYDCIKQKIMFLVQIRKKG
jgi:hypothetical protein